MRNSCLLLAALLTGCGSSGAPVKSVAHNLPGAKTGRKTEHVAPPPKMDWRTKLAAAEDAIAAKDLDGAKKLLAGLDAAEVKKELSEEQQQQLASLEADLNAALDLAADERRKQLLAAAGKSLADGELEEASRALDAVLASRPTGEQRTQAGELRRKIEHAGKKRRDLMSQMRLLATKQRSNFVAARRRLWEDAEVALPMLLDALESDNPVLVENAMEVLRIFNRPDRTIPAVVGVLANPSQQESWPAAVGEIHKLEHAGAGPRLLELAVKVEQPQQQAAILGALAGANDPPLKTLTSLLPVLQRDGPALKPALQSAARAVLEHHQRDLSARRGLPPDLTPEQQKLLEQFPARLEAIIAGDSKDGQLGEVARAAMVLAIASGQKQANPIKGVAISEPRGDAVKGVMDGQWTKTEPETLWTHPQNVPKRIRFDLGKVYTITGIRVWNLNAPGATHRGWKEVDVFVGENRSLPTPLRRVVVPFAPGRADAHDYSVTLHVPFVQGRYIKLQAASLWRDDGNGGGLTEVEILGF